jgi:hypothetical protein
MRAFWEQIFFFRSPSTLNCVFENSLNLFEIVTSGMSTTRAGSLKPRKGCAPLVYEGKSEYERKRCHVVLLHSTRGFSCVTEVDEAGHARQNEAVEFLHSRQ